MARTCEAPGCSEPIPRDEIEAMDWRWLVSTGGRGALCATLICPGCIARDMIHVTVPGVHDLVTQVGYGHRIDIYPGTTTVTSKRKACKHVRSCYRSRIKLYASMVRARRRA